MQIDFHHGVVYLLSRIAGFNAKDASTIAYASQYVDDATNAGLIKFNNGAMYSRISSAHKMLDIRNFNQLKNLQVWTPFHFLPGNGGLKAGENPNGKFIQKLVCTPNSPVAADMVEYCLKDADKIYGLHRLGISLHVLGDTFSHMGFAGVSHRINDVQELNSELFSFRKDKWKNRIQRFTSRFVDNLLPLGHAAALDFPEYPFIKWDYINGMGERIERDNPSIYFQGTEALYDFIVRFRGKMISKKLPQSLPEKDVSIIKHNIHSFREEDHFERYKRWINSILEDDFSFEKEPGEEIIYVPKGQGSWKHEALNTEKETDDEKDIFDYKPEFLTSNWKCFHVAIQKHRLEILNDILPEYGICGA
jgi:hypothetical protein